MFVYCVSFYSLDFYGLTLVSIVITFTMTQQVNSKIQETDRYIRITFSFVFHCIVVSNECSKPKELKRDEGSHSNRHKVSINERTIVESVT